MLRSLTLLAFSCGFAITSQAACVTPPSGLVSWWKAEGDSLDSIGPNGGTAYNGVSFSAGMSGQAFNLNGAGAHVRLPDSPSLDFSNAITIEGWIYPTNVTAYHDIFSKWDMVGGIDQRSYATGLLPDGTLGFTLCPHGTTVTSLLQSTNTIPTNAWTHFAGTYDGSSMKVYINGVMQNQVAYNLGIFQGTDAVGIGATVGGGAPGQAISSFAGKIDEISVYNRALTDTEVQSLFAAGSDGKCSVPVAPSIVSQPANQTVVVGGTAAFTVGASGSAPLSYQWMHASTNLPDATNASLVISNAQSGDAGVYAVVVTNVVGSATSSNATLTVNLPPPHVKVGAVSAPSGSEVTVPITINANGNENAVGFSLQYTTSLLTFVSANTGSATTGAAFLFNTNTAGRVGIAIALSTGTTLPAGTQEIAEVTFATGITTDTNGTTTTIGIGDVPVPRQVTDANGQNIPATYAAGSVTIAPAEYEADVFPRPGGDRKVNLSDWVLIGRYVAQLDSPTNDNEFQRADCAPRSTKGDGQLSIADWVQAGRYAAGLDPLSLLGGPSSPGPVPPSGIHPMDPGQRDVKVTNNQLLPGQSVSVSVLLNSQGDENALGFTLGFNPGAFSFTSATLGSNASGSTLNVNTNQAANGAVGIALAKSFGTSFTSGTDEVIKVTFRSTGTAGSYAVTLTDQIVRREVSDANASVLTSTYTPGSITVNPPPTLNLSLSGQNLALSWPSAAGDYVLQQTASLTPPIAWTNITPTLATNGNQITALLPTASGPGFYRLAHP
jgi:hypothetical protein